MKNKFEGFYFKHQNGGQAVAFIPGRNEQEAFIQVITNNKSYYVTYPLTEYSSYGIMRIGKNRFSKKGIIIDIEQEDIIIKGRIRYSGLTPLKYDIMGPFQVFPMECRHIVVSMRHHLNGQLLINGEKFDLTGGTGYIEGDSGKSFPAGYTWAQCNTWENGSEDCAVMMAEAKIPFAKKSFRGCIAVVWYQGKEYRLATYKGARIVSCSEQGLVIEQNKLRLQISISEGSGLSLYAPVHGKMSRIIKENIAVRARVQFGKGKKTIFDQWSDFACFEYAPEN